MMSKMWQCANFYFLSANGVILGPRKCSRSEIEQLSTISLQIWTVHMILRYLYLQKRKDQFRPTCAPYGVMTHFGVNFFPQFIFYPFFFLYKIFSSFLIFFFTTFNNISQVIQVSHKCMSHVATCTILVTVK